jgi:hypothetical protein
MDMVARVVAVAFFALPALSASVAACSRQSEPAPGAPPVSSVAREGTLAIGERINQPLVSLADIAKNPDRYANRVVATAGKVTAVCQEMGCWMEIQDASGRAHIRMHGHAFFVPKTASGHQARVQATVLTSGGASAGSTAEDCTDKSSLAKVELDATGVELD